ncbi:30S ribosomal protein S7 [Candidatus Geothermarchaeota archaeon ex4572_27]|nr:MAG: 30S ribosomal protein S7 [Candidatus Geothermarchaeota archaeon ex4572_27]
MTQKVKLPELKLFGRYTWSDVVVEDIGLKDYICLKPMILPWSGGRHEHKRFGKAEVNIVERLVNKLMRGGRNGGKKAKAIKIVKAAFRIIELETGRNPIQVLVDAIQLAAPCEDVTTIAYGGAVYHVAVDVSPQRRVDVALRNIVVGAKEAAKSNHISIEEALARELILASKGDPASYAISKRIETERIALASR